MAHAYGTQALKILGTADNKEALGTDFGHGLTQNEVDYLMSQEWATTAEDILWRRTKMGLYLSKEEQEKLRDYISQKQ